MKTLGRGLTVRHRVCALGMRVRFLLAQFPCPRYGGGTLKWPDGLATTKSVRSSLILKGVSMSQAFTKKKLKQRCCRCGWVLEKIGHNWYCRNSTCFYNTNRHKVR